MKAETLTAEFCVPLLVLLKPPYSLPPSFSLPTRSSTVSTFIPACLCGGSSTLSTSSRDVRSTPKSAGFTLAIFFFLAFWKRRGEKEEGYSTSSEFMCWFKSVSVNLNGHKEEEEIQEFTTMNRSTSYVLYLALLITLPCNLP